MKTKLILTIATLLITSCAIAQTTLPIIGSDDPIDHWRVTIWLVDNSVEADVEIATGDTVSLSWMQPLGMAGAGDTVEFLPDGEIITFFGVYVSQVDLTMFGIDSAGAEYRVYELLFYPGTYSVAVRATTVGGSNSLFSQSFPFRVVAAPGQQYPPMAPVRIKITIGG